MSEACYLVYDSMDGGTVYAQYTQTEPPSWMACGYGGNPIPKHKFQGSGREKLKSKCNAAKDFYGVWVLWLKEQKRANNLIVLNTDDTSAPHQVMVVKHTPDNKVTKCGNEFSLGDADAIACVPPQNQDFNSPTMQQELFLQKPRASYGGTAL